MLSDIQIKVPIHAQKLLLSKRDPELDSENKCLADFSVNLFLPTWILNNLISCDQIKKKKKKAILQ